MDGVSPREYVLWVEWFDEVEGIWFESPKRMFSGWSGLIRLKVVGWSLPGVLLVGGVV